MIISRVSGGLGNQLFQYAMGRSLSLKYNTELKIDNTIQRHLSEHGFFKIYKNIIFRKYVLDHFNIHADIAQRSEIPWWARNYLWGKIRSSIDGVRRRILFHKVRERHPYLFQEKFLHTGPNGYLDGDWQSYKYFEKYQNEIRKELTLQKLPEQKILDLGKKMQSEQSVCMHMRRGDYVGNSFHGITTSDYYYNGLAEIEKTVPVNNVYIFSDDINWCRENIQLSVPITFVDHTFAGDHDLGHFWLMQQCKHFIIANSTFSWWAAWLADYPEKIVIAPKKWVNDDTINMQDLIPIQWMLR